jgi:hypothetical protein
MDGTLSGIWPRLWSCYDGWLLKVNASEVAPSISKVGYGGVYGLCGDAIYDAINPVPELICLIPWVQSILAIPLPRMSDLRNAMFDGNGSSRKLKSPARNEASHGAWQTLHGTFNHLSHRDCICSFVRASDALTELRGHDLGCINVLYNRILKLTIFPPTPILSL